MALARVIGLAVAAAVLAAAAGGAAAAATGDGDRREVRVAGVCTGASTTRLRLRAEDGYIRADFRIEAARAGLAWRVVVLHERRIVFAGTVRARAGSRSAELRRFVPDWLGTDTVAVRATGARETCRASATV